MLLEGTITGVQGSQLYMNKFNWYNSGDTSLFPNDMALRAAVTLGYVVADPTAPEANSFLEKLRDLFALGFGLRQLYFRDVYNINDFFVTPLTGTGWEGALTLVTIGPSFEAVGATSSRTRSDIKAGHKSLPSVPETSKAGYDGLIAPGEVEIYQDVMDSLDDGLDIGVGVGFEFFGNAIVSKQKYTTPSGKDAYRYYADPEVQFTHIASPVTWTVQNYLTTRVSRKRGRGR